MGRIVITDEVSSVRDSLAIVLNGEHDVTVAGSLPAAIEAAASADLLIAGASPSMLNNKRAALFENLPDHCRLLLLGQAAALELSSLVRPTQTIAFLSKPFDVSVLRQKVRDLLERPTMPVAALAPAIERRQRRFVQSPFVPAAAALLLRRALTCNVPVLLVGERGTGKRRIARALHELRGGRYFCHKTAEDCPDSLLSSLRPMPSGGESGGGLTLYLEEIERMTPAVHRELLLLLDSGSLPAADPETGLWVVASAARSVDSLVASGSLCPELAYRLGALLVELPPLRERGADLGRLIDLISQEVTDRLKPGRPIRLGPGAIERLQHYVWFGNMPELEAVIARTATITGGGEIDAGDLMFTPDQVLASLAGEPGRHAYPVTVPALSQGDLQAETVEAMLGEIAHELKNPMVTIKTFAQHIDNILDDRASLQGFLHLVDDAVGRMDDLLERLLEFSRYRQPVISEVDLSSLLQAPLRHFREAAGMRKVSLKENLAGTSRVLADERQLAFSLALLFEALGTEMHAGAEVDLTLDSTGTLSVSVMSDYAPIRDTTEENDTTEKREPLTLAPIRAALAGIMIRRNGGSLVIARRDDRETAISVRLPQGQSEPRGGGGGDGKA